MIWTIISFAFSFFPFLASFIRPALDNKNPLDAARLFKSKFQKSYGRRIPNFFQGSYSEALELAKRELKFMVIYLHNESHKDIEEYCIDTLCSELFISFIEMNNIIFWAGDIGNLEAYKVASVAGAIKYPFLALISLHDNRMKIVHRFFGMLSAEDIVTNLQSLQTQLEPSYIVARTERAERNAGRSIREQQDVAYQRSLEQDRQKAEIARKEKEEKKKKEEALEMEAREKERLRQEKLSRKEDLKQNMVPEPGDDVDRVTKMNIRLISGKRLIRKFDADAKIQQLYDFIEAHDLSPIDLLEDFIIVNSYPRKEYRDRTDTFYDVGLFPNATVLVERADPHILE